MSPQEGLKLLGHIINTYISCIWAKSNVFLYLGLQIKTLGSSLNESDNLIQTFSYSYGSVKSTSTKIDY